MMRAAVAALALAACERPAGDAAAEKFIRANVPARGVDVSAFSGGFQHAGVPTADVDGSVDFYRGLGFELAMRRSVGGRDFAFMRLGTMLVELIPTDSPALRAGATDHVCLDVRGADGLFVRLREAGYRMASDSVSQIAFWENGARYFFITGPNGEKIEFCEVL